MIADTQELHSTLQHLTSLTNMLTAIYLDAKERNDFALFPITAEGYFVKVQELNAEVRAYLQSHCETANLVLPQTSPIAQEVA